MSKEIYKKYTESFKQEVVREYESGASMEKLREKYGIGGGSTIRNWIEKYSREGFRHKLLVIQSPEEQNQMKTLKKKVGQLEKLVAQLMLDKVMLESTLELAEERLGMKLKKIGVPA